VELDLDAVPSNFVLYGGTALALQLGRRVSEDFDFFSLERFRPRPLAIAPPPSDSLGESLFPGQAAHPAVAAGLATKEFKPMMITEPYVAELIRIARKVVWFDAPEQALRDLKTFLAHSMVYGSPADIAVVERYLQQDEFRKVPEDRRQGCSLWKPGPFGISLGIAPIPPLPRRRFRDGTLGLEPGTFFGR
jgi:hypothetical protein